MATVDRTVAALLACSTSPQAMRYEPLDMPDAVDLPAAFFPDDLDAFVTEAFVTEWSARFLRNPKAWGRIRGLDAMFDRAHRGLGPAPAQDGAVLFLAPTLV